MIRSMTGFGRAQASVEGFNITAEIKSVNNNGKKTLSLIIHDGYSMKVEY